jgi:hypothetical protein
MGRSVVRELVNKAPKVAPGDGSPEWKVQLGRYHSLRTRSKLRALVQAAWNPNPACQTPRAMAKS